MVPEELIALAMRARQNAYVPYSGFAVGAALLANSGEVYTGCNVENSSYGLTVCAERVALFNAVARGEREFIALAVVCGTEEYCSPCGACRQVLAEFGGDTKVYLANRYGAYQETTVAELLPIAFSLKDHT
ncbi:Cytidine deaminase [Sporotomaculum syntrophicum]|uniref:Cytidine deaminase n=1 Tax=Sporotomaculum syntrophicum TaxID=182264 RepID=A0A9D3AXT7_9FIRM|nr:cytidine deaminase [Sporotomaculum syntrophicum]KAF1084074.1 Cytidine deaminase [Sporotomaculum syntrophicum]